MTTMGGVSSVHADDMADLINQQMVTITTDNVVSPIATPSPYKTTRPIDDYYVNQVTQAAYVTDTQTTESIQQSQQARVQQSNYQTPTVGSDAVNNGVSDDNPFYQSYANTGNIQPEHIGILYHAEQSSNAPAQEVLRQARTMTLDEQKIIRGSCWDYLNAVFGQAMVNRDKVFVGDYPNGPFINSDAIRAGDWLYFVNHSYHDIQHSGLFIGWVDEAQNQALILSYAGESRREPARYKVYDISHVYNVMRPKSI